MNRRKNKFDKITEQFGVFIAIGVTILILWIFAGAVNRTFGDRPSVKTGKMNAWGMNDR